MTPLPKTTQTTKNKKANLKRMSKTEMKDFRQFISEHSDRVCQLCNTEMADDAHHPIFGCRGADKDDRCQVGVCRKCHELCHRDKHGYLNTLAEEIGHNNYLLFKESCV